MRKAAHIALAQCMGLKKSESVLIVTDKPRKKIATAFFNEAVKLAKNVLLITIPVGKIDGEEPPKHVAELMRTGYDVLLLVTTKSLSHTKATSAARKAGAKIASMPEITIDMAKRCLPVNYKKMSALNRKLLAFLKRTNIVRITTSKGTDLTIVAKGRKLFDDNGILTKKHALGNLPAGEVAFPPLEGKTNGVFVVDASILDFIVKTPIKIMVKNGYACSITGGKEAKTLFKLIKPLGKSAFNIAELGIGTNPKAKITGNILEDEKVISTCHIALGNSEGLGGKIYAKCHLDGVMKKPTIYFDKKCIMKSGKFLI